MPKITKSKDVGESTPKKPSKSKPPEKVAPKKPSKKKAEVKAEPAPTPPTVSLGPKLILALDPATYTTGYAIIKWDGANTHLIKAGYFDIPKGLKYGERMHLFKEKSEILINKVKPTNLIIEKPYLGPNPTTFMALSGGYGILTMLAFEHNLPLIAMPPTDAKAHLLGTTRMKGKESKRKIKIMMENFFNVSFTKDDESDAVATAVTGIDKYISQGIDEHY